MEQSYSLLLPMGKEDAHLSFDSHLFSAEGCFLVHRPLALLACGGLEPRACTQVSISGVFTRTA